MTTPADRFMMRDSMPNWHRILHARSRYWEPGTSYAFQLGGLSRYWAPEDRIRECAVPLYIYAVVHLCVLCLTRLWPHH